MQGEENYNSIKGSYCTRCGKYLTTGKIMCDVCETNAYQFNNVEYSDNEKNMQMVADNNKSAVGGNHREDSINHNNIKDKKEKRKKKKVILFSVCFLIVILAALYFVFIYKKPINVIKRALDRGNIDDVINLYDSLEGDDLEYANTLIEDYIKKVKMGYINEDENYDYDTTISILNNFNDCDLENVNIKRTRELINNINQSRTHYISALKFEENKNYPEAIAELNKVIKDDTKYYEQAITKINEDKTIYRDNVLEKSAEYKNQSMYSEAENVLRDALDVLVNDSEVNSELILIESMHEEQTVSEYKETAKKLVDDGDYRGALALIEDYNDDNYNEDLAEYYNEIYTTYYNIAIEAAENKFQEDGWSAAYNELETYYDVFSGDDDYDEKLNYYLSFRPILLASQKVFSGTYDDEPILDVYEDRLNNTFENGFIMYSPPSFEDCYYLEWYVGEMYSELSGTIAFSSYDNMAVGLGYSGVIKIYADDVLIYTSNEVFPKTKPFDFKLDITGIEYIRIENIGECDVIMNEVILKK